MNVTFRQLRLLEAVARHSSFTRASEELHLTQPAVSTQIKQLEEEVGMPLFEQMGKKIFLTEVGKHRGCLGDGFGLVDGEFSQGHHKNFRFWIFDFGFFGELTTGNRKLLFWVFHLRSFFT